MMNLKQRTGILAPLTAAVLAVVFVSAVAAQTLPNAKTAAKQLFKTGKNKTVVRILKPDLVPAAYQTALQNAAKIQRYYEAMAASPTEGLLGGSASHAINHHTAAAAHAAAIAGCNAKKKKSAAGCVVVAEFLPKGYKGPRAFSLSASASEVFAKKYKRSGKSKAFAISASTGHWGESVKAANAAEASAAAMAMCQANAAKVGGDDCVVISVD